jgi:hypothetical protein
LGHYVGIGHSHLASIASAYEEFEVMEPGQMLLTSVNFLLPPYFPEVEVREGVTVLNPVWVTTMRQELDDPDVIMFLCVSGSEWWRWSLTPGPQPFDFVDPLVEDGLSPIGQLVPYDLFLRKAKLTFDSIRFVTETVRKYTSAPMLQFAPPPPARNIAAAVAAAPNLRHLIEDHGVSPAHFRLKVWRACARAMGEVCAENGVDFLMPPPDALDQDGFLGPDMVHDHIHGNASWGRLQLKRLRARSRRRSRVI